MISVQNLHKSYGELVAVDGISFEVARGESFGFLGPNGAGKSTSLNMLGGVLTPDSGEIHIDGANDPTRPKVRTKLGSAPQSLALYDEMTGWENVSFFGSLYGISGRKLRSQIEWSLDFVGLTGRSRDRVRTYSGGMMRRLNLACALVHEPAVLLLDEPTVGVDPQSRNMIFERIEELKKRGRTVIYTTHYMEEAERLCDRIAIIDNGKILAMDTVDKLIAQHAGDSVVHMDLNALPDDPSLLPGTLEGAHIRVETGNPLKTISELTGHGLQVSSLRIDRADLETVFLNLTGRSLRD